MSQDQMPTQENADAPEDCQSVVGLCPFIGTKIILAEPMTALDFEVKFKGEPKPDGNPISLDGFHVQYSNPDGSKYDSWSPRGVFMRAYRPVGSDEMEMLAVK